MRSKGIKAWLVTWDGVDDARVCGEERIAAIISCRSSAKRVNELVELLYVNTEFTLDERLLYARNRSTPYRAEFVPVAGVPWEGQIICGHNPHLFARLVDDLRLDPGAPAGLSWAERPKPSPSRTTIARSK